MRKICLYLILSTAGFAQWIVNDPVNTTVAITTQANQIAQHAEILRQWAVELEKLNEQVRILQGQLEVARQVRDIAGDPRAAGEGVVLDQLWIEDLTRELGRTLGTLRELSSSAESLKDTANGIYAPIDDRTSLGGSFARQSLPYRRYAAVEQAADNLEMVRQVAGERRTKLQGELGAALVRLRSAGTQAEVDKLQGQIAALNGQLAVMDGAERQAAAQLSAQQVLNENQAAKEAQDLLEKQIAEERTTLGQLRSWQEGIRISSGGYGK